MKRFVLALLTLSLALVPALVTAHPPAVDLQSACARDEGTKTLVDLPGGFVVSGLVSALAPLGSGLSCTPGADDAEWGSHVLSCPPPPLVGPIHGAFCGPVVPPLASVTCSWQPRLNDPELPVGVVVGFDAARVDPEDPVPVFDGLVGAGDGPVFGPFPSGSWTVTNPHLLPSRVVAYPTNAELAPHPRAGVTDSGVSVMLNCIVP